MRIAFFIFGQVRTFERTYTNILNYISLFPGPHREVFFSLDSNSEIPKYFQTVFAHVHINESIRCKHLNSIKF